MQHSHWTPKRLTILATLLIFTLLLAACGSDIPESEPQTAPAAVDNTPMAAEEDEVSAEAETAETGGMTDTIDTPEIGAAVEATEIDDSETMAETEDMTDTVDTPDIGAAVEATEIDEATDIPIVGVSGAQGMLVRGYTLLDYGFENRDGEVSGELEDLLIDAETGEVIFASIEYGGFLDIGDKDVVMPLSAFIYGPEGNLVLNFDEATLENYPDLGNNWPDLTDPVWDDDVRTFWRDNDVETGVDFTEGSTSVLWLEDLTGYSLVDLGEGIGTVQDVLVDLGDSRIKYVLFGFGAAAADTNPFILPYSAMSIDNLDSNELAFDTAIDLETLRLAPRYDRNLYPDLDVLEAGFGPEIDAYWAERGFDVDE